MLLGRTACLIEAAGSRTRTHTHTHAHTHTRTCTCTHTHMHTHVNTHTICILIWTSCAHDMWHQHASTAFFFESLTIQLQGVALSLRKQFDTSPVCSLFWSASYSRHVFITLSPLLCHVPHPTLVTLLV